MVVGGKSCSQILDFLKRNKTATQKQLIESGFPERTVKHSLKKLTNMNIIHEYLSFDDLRKKTYLYGGEK